MAIIQTGRVTGSKIKKNKDGEKNVLMLQVEVTEPDDIQSIQLMKQAGEDTHPPADSQIVILSIGEAFKIAVASDDGVEPSMGEGEKKLYSVSGGAISAFINFLSTGILELNGNSDNAVRYSALETKLKELEDNLNTHIHTTTATVGATSTAGVISVPTELSDVDFLPAKVKEVKII